MGRTMRRRPRTGRGATAVEYALLIALIAAVIIGAIILLGGKVFGLLDLSADPRW